MPSQPPVVTAVVFLALSGTACSPAVPPGVSQAQTAVSPVAPRAPASGCPADMVRVPTVGGDVCIHRYEARLEGDAGARDGSFPPPRPPHVVAEAGALPTSGVCWYRARAACTAVGYHLCTCAEWEDACDGQAGPGGDAFPTPSGLPTPSRCPIAGPWVPPAPSPSGAWPLCQTRTGIFDLAGNLWEWCDPGASDEAGRPLTDKRGGAHYSGDWAACSQAAVGAHPPTFEGTIGFRCCVAASPP